DRQESLWRRARRPQLRRRFGQRTRAKRVQPSPMGLLVCCFVFALAYRVSGALIGALIVALVASIAFGSTSLMTLSALGGATPLIFTAFSLLLVGTVAARKSVLKEVGHLFARVPTASVLSILM